VAQLYSPSRVTLAALPEFAKEAVNTALQYANWLIDGDVEKDCLVLPGMGPSCPMGSRRPPYIATRAARSTNAPRCVRISEALFRGIMRKKRGLSCAWLAL